MTEETDTRTSSNMHVVFGQDFSKVPNNKSDDNDNNHTNDNDSNITHTPISTNTHSCMCGS